MKNNNKKKQLLRIKTGTATSSPIRVTVSRIFEYLRKKLRQIAKYQKLDSMYSEVQ